MIFGSTFSGTNDWLFHLVGTLMSTDLTDEIRPLSLGRERSSKWVLVAQVAVVRNSVFVSQRPDEFVEVVLIECVAHFVLKGAKHGPGGSLYLLPLLINFGSPHSAKNVSKVHLVISHYVESSLALVEPFVDSIHLPLPNQTVAVSRHEEVHCWIE